MYFGYWTLNNKFKKYIICCCPVESGCILVFSVPVLSFPLEFSLFYIRMVIPIWHCRLLVVVLCLSIVLLRVCDITASQRSIHCFVSNYLCYVVDGLCCF